MESYTRSPWNTFLLILPAAAAAPAALATFLLACRCRNITCEECDRSLPFLALPLVSGGIRSAGSGAKGWHEQEKKEEATDRLKVWGRNERGARLSAARCHLAWPLKELPLGMTLEFVSSLATESGRLLLLHFPSTESANTSQLTWPWPITLIIPLVLISPVHTSWVWIWIPQAPLCLRAAAQPLIMCRTVLAAGKTWD